MAVEWLWMIGMALGADCREPATPDGLDAELDAAEGFFADLEIAAFIGRSDQVRHILPCLRTVPEPILVARIHRVEGLRLFGERSVDAVRAFAAARALDDAYAFPPELAPPGSPILEDYAVMDLEAHDSETLPEPVAGQLHIDGSPGRERPTAWPTLVQLVNAEGGVSWTAYLDHGAEPPKYEAIPEPEPEPEAVAEPEIVYVTEDAPRRSPRVPLLVAAGTTAVASGVLYGVAASTRSTYMDPATPDPDLPGLRARTNTLAVASGIGGAVTLGLGVGVALTW